MKIRSIHLIWIAALILVAAIAAFLLWPHGGANRPEGPPRAQATALPKPSSSQVSLPVRLPLEQLEKGLEDAVPTTLWTLDEKLQTCAAAARLKLFGKKVKITPDIKCRVSGTAKRGRIRLEEQKGGLRLLLPVSGELVAGHIGGLGITERATAEALVTADVFPSVTPEGHLTARIKLNYDWETEPGVQLLGNRIKLTKQADAKLAPVLAKLERDLPMKLRPVALQKELAGVWRQGFTVQSINRRNPAAWIKITPLALGLDRISVDGRYLVVHASLTAITELILGAEPKASAPTAMPLIQHGPAGSQVRVNAQLLADYNTLVPPIRKALNKVSARGINLPEIGLVQVKFGEPTLYGTTGGRLVMGIAIAARGPRKLLDTKGYVWMTARAETKPGSEQVAIRDIRLDTGTGSDSQFGLLAAIMSSEAVTLALEEALDQDFTGDYRKLMVKIRRALTEIPIGDFRLAVTLDSVEHGKISALGQGLYMPVSASGSAVVTYAGPNAPPPARLRKPASQDNDHAIS